MLAQILSRNTSANVSVFFANNYNYSQKLTVCYADTGKSWTAKKWSRWWESSKTDFLSMNCPSPWCGWWCRRVWTRRSNGRRARERNMWQVFQSVTCLTSNHKQRSRTANGAEWYTFLTGAWSKSSMGRLLAPMHFSAYCSLLLGQFCPSVCLSACPIVWNIRSTAKMVSDGCSYYGEPVWSHTGLHKRPISDRIRSPLPPKLEVGNRQLKIASQTAAERYQIQ